MHFGRHSNNFLGIRGVYSTNTGGISGISCHQFHRNFSHNSINFLGLIIFHQFSYNFQEFCHHSIKVRGISSILAFIPSGSWDFQILQRTGNMTRATHTQRLTTGTGATAPPRITQTKIAINSLWFFVMYVCNLQVHFPISFVRVSVLAPMVRGTPGEFRRVSWVSVKPSDWGGLGRFGSSKFLRNFQSSPHYTSLHFRNVPDPFVREKDAAFDTKYDWAKVPLFLKTLPFPPL